MVNEEVLLHMSVTVLWQTQLLLPLLVSDVAIYIANDVFSEI